MPARTYSSLAVFTLVMALPCVAQSITGSVRDKATIRPLANATITLSNSQNNKRLVVTTDTAGQFAFKDMRAGNFTLLVEKDGKSLPHGPFPIFPRERVQLDILFIADSARLNVQTQTNRMRKLESAGFYERFAAGRGQFVIREDVAKENPRALSDLLMNMRGVRISFGPRGGDAVMRSSATGGSLSTGAMCRPAIMLDGAVVRGSGADSESLVLDQVETPEHIEGIEIYSGPAQLPPEYSGLSNSCGAILIWTR